MIVEFRFYAVADGRMASELALVHAMAIAGAPEIEGGPPMLEETLWQRYGVPLPLGSWVTLAGSSGPGFLYLMPWRSLSERDAIFPRFWTDPFWRAKRAELTAGATLVESIETWILEPLAGLGAFRDPPGPSVDGIHELRLLKVVNNTFGEARTALATVDLPALAREGARLLGAFEVAIGPDRPQIVLLLAWENAAAQADGWLAVESDAAVIAAREAETARHGRPLFFAIRSWLLDPMEWNRPAPNLGLPEDTPV